MERSKESRLPSPITDWRRWRSATPRRTYGWWSTGESTMSAAFLTRWGPGGGLRWGGTGPETLVGCVWEGSENYLAEDEEACRKGPRPFEGEFGRVGGNLRSRAFLPALSSGTFDSMLLSPVERLLFAWLNFRVTGITILQKEYQSLRVSHLTA